MKNDKNRLITLRVDNFLAVRHYSTSKFVVFYVDHKELEYTQIGVIQRLGSSKYKFETGLQMPPNTPSEFDSVYAIISMLANQAGKPK